MWNSFLEEVKTLQTFLEQQKRILTPQTFEKVADDHMKNLVSKVTSLGRSSQLKADDVSTFVGIVGMGPWNEEEKRRLSVAASDALLQAQSPGKRRALQNCKTFAGYFTQSDVNLLKGDHSMVMKLDCSSTQIANQVLHGTKYFCCVPCLCSCKLDVLRACFD